LLRRQLSDAGPDELIHRFTDSAPVAVLSPDGARVLTAGINRPTSSTSCLADNVVAACALLADHPTDRQEVRVLCSQERLTSLTASARPLYVLEGVSLRSDRGWAARANQGAREAAPVRHGRVTLNDVFLYGFSMATDSQGILL
jgi:hypothetical protein